MLCPFPSPLSSTPLVVIMVNHDPIGRHSTTTTLVVILVAIVVMCASLATLPPSPTVASRARNHTPSLNHKFRASSLAPTLGFHKAI
jgi:hypothetical protein